MGREVEYPLTPQLELNLSQLMSALNIFRKQYGHPMVVTSGYRPGKYNKAAGGASNSSHMACEAADFLDKNKSIANFIISRPEVLEECGLWMEHPDSTVGWTHLQIRRIPSGHRIFRP